MEYRIKPLVDYLFVEVLVSGIGLININPCVVQFDMRNCDIIYKNNKK